MTPLSPGFDSVSHSDPSDQSYGLSRVHLQTISQDKSIVRGEKSAGEALERIDSHLTTDSIDEGLDSEQDRDIPVDKGLEKKRNREWSSTGLIFRIDRIGEFNEVPYATTLPPNEELLQEAKQAANKFKGVCLSGTCFSRSQPLEYICAIGHRWKSSRLLKTGEWCRRCVKKLRKARKYADSNGGMLLTKIAEAKVTFKCTFGHVWSEEIGGYFSRKWCQRCYDDRKSREKQAEIEAKQREDKEKESLQQSLFAEARKCSKSPIIAMESHTITEKMTEKTDINVEEIMKLSNEGIRHAYFQAEFTVDRLKTTFKALAKMLHPDKNRHPMAHETFIKVQKAYENARSERRM